MKIKIPAGGLCLLLLALILSSCQIRQSIRPFPVKTLDLISEQELTSESQPTIPDAISQAPCAYMWASQPLPQISREFENLINQADFKDIQVFAEAYGENCVTEEGEIVRFAAMQTDIHMVVPVQSLNHPTEMGDIAGRLLGVILEVPLSALPGLQPGYIGIQFSSNEGEVLNLWFKREKAEQLLQAGINGEKLLDELQKK